MLTLLSTSLTIKTVVYLHNIEITLGICKLLSGNVFINKELLVKPKKED